MRSVTRRTALKGTGAVIAVTAASVPMLAAQSNPDARVFALIEEHGCAARAIKVAWDRFRLAAREALPPRLLNTNYLDRSREDQDLFSDILSRPGLKALSKPAQRLEDDCKAVVERLAKTPASTLEGIHAKFQDAIKVGWQGRYLKDNIALSAVDDLARLVGEAPS